MDTKDTLLSELGSTSLDNLHKILAAIRLRQATMEDDNKDDSSDHKADQATAPLPDNNTHQDQPVAPKEPDHAGIFAIVYANNTLVHAHADLYAEFDVVDPGNIHQYMHELNKINVAQRPCFIVCTGGTAPSLTVLHGIAVHWRNLHAKSKYDGRTYAFIHDPNPGERVNMIEFLSAWFDKETVTTSTYDAFSTAIKNASRAATLDTENSPQKSTS